MINMYKNSGTTKKAYGYLRVKIINVLYLANSSVTFNSSCTTHNLAIKLKIRTKGSVNRVVKYTKHLAHKSEK